MTLSCDVHFSSADGVVADVRYLFATITGASAAELAAIQAVDIMDNSRNPLEVFSGATVTMDVDATNPMVLNVFVSFAASSFQGSLKLRLTKTDDSVFYATSSGSLTSSVDSALIIYVVLGLNVIFKTMSADDTVFPSDQVVALSDTYNGGAGVTEVYRYAHDGDNVLKMKIGGGQRFASGRRLTSSDDIAGYDVVLLTNRSDTDIAKVSYVSYDSGDDTETWKISFIDSTVRSAAGQNITIVIQDRVSYRVKNYFIKLHRYDDPVLTLTPESHSTAYARSSDVLRQWAYGSNAFYSIACSVDGSPITLSSGNFFVDAGAAALVGGTNSGNATGLQLTFAGGVATLEKNTSLITSSIKYATFAVTDLRYCPNGHTFSIMTSGKPWYLSSACFAVGYYTRLSASAVQYIHGSAAGTHEYLRSEIESAGSARITLSYGLGNKSDITIGGKTAVNGLSIPARAVSSDNTASLAVDMDFSGTITPTLKLTSTSTGAGTTFTYSDFAIADVDGLSLTSAWPASDPAPIVYDDMEVRLVSTSSAYMNGTESLRYSDYGAVTGFYANYIWKADNATHDLVTNFRLLVRGGKAGANGASYTLANLSSVATVDGTGKITAVAKNDVADSFSLAASSNGVTITDALGSVLHIGSSLAANKAGRVFTANFQTTDYYTANNNSAQANRGIQVHYYVLPKISIASGTSQTASSTADLVSSDTSFYGDGVAAASPLSIIGGTSLLASASTFPYLLTVTPVIYDGVDVVDTVVTQSVYYSGINVASGAVTSNNPPVQNATSFTKTPDSARTAEIGGRTFTVRITIPQFDLAPTISANIHTLWYDFSAQRIYRPTAFRWIFTSGQNAANQDVSVSLNDEASLSGATFVSTVKALVNDFKPGYVYDSNDNATRIWPDSLADLAPSHARYFMRNFDLHIKSNTAVKAAVFARGSAPSSLSQLGLTYATFTNNLKAAASNSAGATSADILMVQHSSDTDTSGSAVEFAACAYDSGINNVAAMRLSLYINPAINNVSQLDTNVVSSLNLSAIPSSSYAYPTYYLVLVSESGDFASFPLQIVSLATIESAALQRRLLASDHTENSIAYNLNASFPDSLCLDAVLTPSTGSGLIGNVDWELRARVGNGTNNPSSASASTSDAGAIVMSGSNMSLLAMCAALDALPERAWKSDYNATPSWGVASSGYMQYRLLVGATTSGGTDVNTGTRVLTAASPWFDPLTDLSSNLGISTIANVALMCNDANSADNRVVFRRAVTYATQMTTTADSAPSGVTGLSRRILGIRSAASSLATLAGSRTLLINEPQWVDAVRKETQIGSFHYVSFAAMTAISPI